MVPSPATLAFPDMKGYLAFFCKKVVEVEVFREKVGQKYDNI